MAASPKKSKKKASPKPIDASKYRKLTPTELEKLGLGRKTERYILQGKTVRKTTKTVSKRQYLSGQRGGLSNEAYQKQTRVEAPHFHEFKKSNAKSGNREGYEQYHMPLNKPAFEKKAAKLRAKYPEDARYYLVLVFTDHSYSGDALFLRRLSWDGAVERELELFSAEYRGKATKGKLQAIYCRVYI